MHDIEPGYIGCGRRVAVRGFVIVSVHTGDRRHRVSGRCLDTIVGDTRTFIKIVAGPRYVIPRDNAEKVALRKIIVYFFVVGYPTQLRLCLS